MFTTPTYTPVGGFIDGTGTVLGSRLRAGWLNYVSGQLPNALDAINGGYYQFVEDIELSSDTKQIKINAPAVGQPTKLLGYTTIGLSDDANYATGTGTLTVAIPATFTAGVTISGAITFSNTVQFNGAVTVNAATTFTSNGDVTLQSGCAVTGSSGSSLTMDSGSTTTINGAATLAGTNTISGATTFSNSATFTNGLTVTQSASNTAAITSTGNGTGAGAALTGGTTGPGLTAVNGTAQTNSAPTMAGQFAGYIRLTGTDPDEDIDPGANNVLHGANICKAWCVVILSGGGPYNIEDGYNIDEVVYSGTPDVINVTFARAMANANYSVVFAVEDVNWHACINGTKTTSGFQFSVYNTTDGTLGGSGQTINFQVFGRQA
jgi:hypothetical protein